MTWLKVSVLVVSLGAFVAVWQMCSRASSTAQQVVELEMEAYGGFAYIRETDKLNVAFLASSNRADCFVGQLGTDLFVVSGVIETPASSPSRKFDVGGAVVTFPGLNTATTTLQAHRGARPNGRPSPPHEEPRWHDLKWVAGISSGALGTDYPDSQLRPDWRDVVDGRVEITRGEVRGSHPSDVAIQHAVFEFKLPGPATAMPHAAAFTQAMTDRTIWSVRVPGNSVEILITGGRGDVSRIIIRPTQRNRPVKLRLIGRHAHGVAPALTEGQRLDHFCAFYDLMPEKSRPAAVAQLMPHVKDLPPGTGSGAGRPSPGAYCPGDWP